MTAENKVSAAELIGELLCTNRAIDGRVLVAVGADKEVLVNFWNSMKPHLKNIRGFCTAHQAPAAQHISNFLASKIGEKRHVLYVGGWITGDADAFLTRDGEFLIVGRGGTESRGLLRLTETFDPIEAATLMRESWPQHLRDNKDVSAFLWLLVHLKLAWKKSIDARKEGVDSESKLFDEATSSLGRIDLARTYP